MLQCEIAYTYELDDQKVALDEITTQLEKKLTLLDHTVGIVLCNPEFISSGVMGYICENLPFDTVGMTTSSQAVSNEAGELILTIFVMTSDDVQFKPGITESVKDGIAEPTKAAYHRVAADCTEEPKLAIILPPRVLTNAGDAYVDAWKQIIPNTPIFGGLAIDDTIAFDSSETIHNGMNYQSSMAFVLCYGNINPRFFIGSLPEDKAMPYKGEVTKADGLLVHEINNIDAYSYFESIGIIDSALHVDRLLFVPFVIDQKTREDYDGVSVIRAHVSFTEDGTAVFRGVVDEGSTLSMLAIDSSDVLSSTQKKTEELHELSDVNGILMFSCIIRRMMTLRANPLAELEVIKNSVGPGIPFMAGYAGGEICPTSASDGNLTNRFHNYSLVILVV